MDFGEHKKIMVLVETAERTFRGYVHKPVAPEDERLSDYLNAYNNQFLSLSDVKVTDRGDHIRVGEQHSFIAIATSAITYITPLEEG